MLTLTIPERLALKGQAHALNPVVMIGNAGLTEAVLKEIDANLNSHQLIKVRVLGDDREARATMMDSICTSLNAAPVQIIGKILVIYRPDPDAGLPAIKTVPKHKRGRRLTKKQLAGNR